MEVGRLDRQPLSIAPLGLRRRVRSHLIRRWVLLQEDLDAGTALRSGLIEIITSIGEEHDFLCSLDQRLASESTVGSQMILPGVLTADTHGTRQVRFPLAGIGEMSVDEGSCSWGEAAEYTHSLQREGIHALLLETGSRTQRARLGPHSGGIPLKKRSASDQHTR